LQLWVGIATLAGLLVGDSVGLSAQVPPPVRDDAGREVRLERLPTRIVSLVPVATEILFALGEGVRVVGRSRFDDYPPAVLEVPSVGDAIRPSVEAVLLRRPDLVILIGGSDNADAVREMERLDLPCLVVLFNTLDDLDRNILRLGRLVAREEEARALWRDISRSLAEVREAVAHVERPVVYYDIAFPPAITAGAGSYLDELLTIAGARNAFGDLPSPSPRVSLEAIVARNPGLILQPVSGGSTPSAPGLDGRPGWASIEAVREGRVRRVDADLVHRLGPRIGLAAEALARAIHPRAFESRDP